MSKTQNAHTGTFFPTFLATFHWFFSCQFIHFTSALILICISIFSFCNTFFATSFYTLIPHTPTCTQIHKNVTGFHIVSCKPILFTFWEEHQHILNHLTQVMTSSMLPRHFFTSHFTQHDDIYIKHEYIKLCMTRISGLQKYFFLFI